MTVPAPFQPDGKASPELARDLSTELCKDLDYSEVYDLAKIAMMNKLSRESVQSLAEEHGERYDYVFLQHGIDPLKLT